jgi:hypothetical protein
MHEQRSQLGNIRIVRFLPLFSASLSTRFFRRINTDDANALLYNVYSFQQPEWGKIRFPGEFLIGSPYSFVLRGSLSLTRIVVRRLRPNLPKGGGAQRRLRSEEPSCVFSLFPFPPVFLRSPPQAEGLPSLAAQPRASTSRTTPRFTRSAYSPFPPLFQTDRIPSQQPRTVPTYPLRQPQHHRLRRLLLHPSSQPPRRRRVRLIPPFHHFSIPSFPPSTRFALLSTDTLPSFIACFTVSTPTLIAHCRIPLRSAFSALCSRLSSVSKRGVLCSFLRSSSRKRRERRVDLTTGKRKVCTARKRMLSRRKEEKGNREESAPQNHTQLLVPPSTIASHPSPSPSSSSQSMPAVPSCSPSPNRPVAVDASLASLLARDGVEGFCGRNSLWR